MNYNFNNTLDYLLVGIGCIVAILTTKWLMGFNDEIIFYFANAGIVFTMLTIAFLVYLVLKIIADKYLL